MVGWSPDTSARAIAIDSVVQGVGLGLVFVPLNTVAFATLPGDLRTDGAALWTLIRNLGSSVGISLIIAQLVSMMTTFHAQLAEDITPFNDAMRMPDAAGMLSTHRARPGRVRGDDHAAGGRDGLFQRLSHHDLRFAGRLPAAGADPLSQIRYRGRGGAGGRRTRGTRR